MQIALHNPTRIEVHPLRNGCRQFYTSLLLREFREKSSKFVEVRNQCRLIFISTPNLALLFWSTHDLIRIPVPTNILAF